jgi:hypothetical protein
MVIAFTGVPATQRGLRHGIQEVTLPPIRGHCPETAFDVARGGVRRGRSTSRIKCADALRQTKCPGGYESRAEAEILHGAQKMLSAVIGAQLSLLSMSVTSAQAPRQHLKDAGDHRRASPRLEEKQAQENHLLFCRNLLKKIERSASGGDLKYGVRFCNPEQGIIIARVSLFLQANYRSRKQPEIGIKASGRRERRIFGRKG